MNLHTLAPVALLGLGLGGGIGWLTTPAPPPVPPAPPPASASAHDRPALVLPSDCRQRRELLEAEAARLEAELKAARLTARVLEAQRVEREGHPQPWPDEVDPRVRPEALETALAEACATTGAAELLDIDCEEFPCIATLVLTQSEIEGTSLHEYAPVLDALEPDDEVGPLLATASAVEGEEDLVKFATVAIGPKGLPQGTQLRTSFRLSKAVEYAQAELEAR